MTDLGFTPSENPFVVENGGFYRRWLSMIDDIGELEEVVSRLEGTTQNHWVPVWREIGRHHEDTGDDLDAAGDYQDARRAFLLAKTYYAIGRFPGEITEVKAEVSRDCARAYEKACLHLDPPLEIVDVPHEGKTIRCHFRAPSDAGPDSPVAAVLIMCGADVFKEDRGWAGELALDHGLASLVMDGPGTGENPFPWAPESVTAWEAAIDYLIQRPEIAADRFWSVSVPPRS